nr:aconitate hydratase, cytoplasmic [Tanacetum cinerariifolium]
MVALKMGLNCEHVEGELERVRDTEKTREVWGNETRMKLVDLGKMYKIDGHDTIVLTGAEYGSGRARDLVSKGAMSLMVIPQGTKVVIAKILRSCLKLKILYDNGFTKAWPLIGACVNCNDHNLGNMSKRK